MAINHLKLFTLASYVSAARPPPPLLLLPPPKPTPFSGIQSGFSERSAASAVEERSRLDFSAVCGQEEKTGDAAVKHLNMNFKK